MTRPLAYAAIFALATQLRARFVRQCRDPDLGGFCDLAADRITRALRRRGHNARTVCGIFVGRRHDLFNDGWHCWTEIDGQILDVTATQFSRSVPAVWWPADPKRYRAARPVRRS